MRQLIKSYRFYFFMMTMIIVVCYQNCFLSFKKFSSSSLKTSNKLADKHFVKICSDDPQNLCINDQKFFAKGHNLFSSKQSSHFTLRNGIEQWSPWEVYYQFDPVAIENEMIFLKQNLGVNTIRLFTPSFEISNDSIYSAYPKWFVMGVPNAGAINSLFLDRLLKILDLAHKNGIKIQLTLFANLRGEVETRIRHGIDIEGVLPGSNHERIYLNHLESLIPALKNHPAILSYEMGNENLLAGTDYYQNPDGDGSIHDKLPAKMISLLKRLIEKTRQLDTNHLISSNETTEIQWAFENQSYWHWPLPDFFEFEDIHNLNQGRPYSLSSLVDFLAMHLYSRPFYPGTDWGGAPSFFNANLEMATATMSAIRARWQKPIILGEFGLYLICGIFPREQFNEYQRRFIQRVGEMVPQQNLAGAIIWVGLPPFNLNQNQTVEITGCSLQSIVLPRVTIKENNQAIRSIDLLYPGFFIFSHDGSLHPGGMWFRDGF